MHIELQSCS